MFWSDTLKEDQCYCTCFASWINMKFSYISIHEPALAIYMTPEDGKKSLIYSIPRGSSGRVLAQLQHEFNGWQHVRIEVVGGEVTMMGTADDQKRKHVAQNRCIYQCPFAGEEDWAMEKYNTRNLNQLHGITELEAEEYLRTQSSG